jgi:hypothetical protein
MTIGVINPSENIPGVPTLRLDGSPQTDAYDAFLDYAYGPFRLANSGDITVEWPIGARIGLEKKPKPRPVPNFHVCWRGASNIGSRGQTRFQALADLGGNMIDHESTPKAEFTGFTCEALVEQNSGALFHNESPYQTKVAIDCINGYRNLSHTNASGLEYEKCHTLGGSLLTPNAWDRLGRGYKQGAHHIVGLAGGAGNNSVTLNQCTSDPDGSRNEEDVINTSNYETSWEVESMDGMWIDRGHCAGGRLAHGRLNAFHGQRINGIKGNMPWFDAHALRAFQIVGDQVVSNIELLMPTFQKSKQFNVAVENPFVQDIHMLSPLNEQCDSRGFKDNMSGGWFFAYAKEVFITKGVTKANGHVDNPSPAIIWILFCDTVEIDQRVWGNNANYMFYVANSANVKLAGRHDSGLLGRVYDGGKNTNPQW